MINTGRWFAVLCSIFFIVIVSLDSFIKGSIVQTIEYLITFLFVIPLWWIGKQYDVLKFQYRERDKENEKLQTKIQELQSSVEEWEKHSNELENTVIQTKENKQKYKAVFENVNDIIIQFVVKNGKPTRIINVNNTAINSLGYSREELLNMSPTDLIPLESTEYFSAMTQTLLEKGTILYEGSYVTKFGEKIPFEFNEKLMAIEEKLGAEKVVLSIARDNTERKELEKKLKEMAYYDELTNLPNRKMLEIFMKKSMKRSKRQQHKMGVFFIDLDGFKNVNDTLGHDVGDALLIEVSDRLNQCIREDDIVARLGGDEFIIVLEDVNKENLTDIAQRIIDKVSEDYYIGDDKANVAPSIGISMYPDDGEDQDTLMQNADKAMYYVKNQGKNNYKFYTVGLEEINVKKVGVFEKIINTFQK